MRCKMCGNETDKLKNGLCRPCFMVAGVENEQLKEALENDLPKEYHTPINKKVSTQEVFILMSQQYQQRAIMDKKDRL